MDKSTSNILVIIIALFGLSGLGFFLYKSTKKDEDLKLALDDGLVNPTLPPSPSLEPTSNKISVRSNEPWVSVVNESYSLTTKGAERFESPAAVVEEAIDRVYASSEWYDGVLADYESLPNRKKKKTSLEKEIMNSAIYVARKIDKNIRKTIF